MLSKLFYNLEETKKKISLLFFYLTLLNSNSRVLIQVQLRHEGGWECSEVEEEEEGQNRDGKLWQQHTEGGGMRQTACSWSLIIFTEMGSDRRNPMWHSILTNLTEPQPCQMTERWNLKQFLILGTDTYLMLIFSDIFCLFVSRKKYCTKFYYFTLYRWGTGQGKTH